MNIRTVFKFIIWLFTWIKVILVSLPFTLALISLVALKQNKFQYGYDFFELNHFTAILISVAIGIVFSVWNAMEFGNHPNVELKQFMKSKQKYFLKTKDNISLEQMQTRVEDLVNTHKKWEFYKGRNNQPWTLIVKNGFAPKDLVTIKQVESRWEITSRPKLMLYFIDLARNYKNVEFVSKYLSKKA